MSIRSFAKFCRYAEGTVSIRKSGSVGWVGFEQSGIWEVDGAVLPGKEKNVNTAIIMAEKKGYVWERNLEHWCVCWEEYYFKANWVLEC